MSNHPPRPNALTAMDHAAQQEIPSGDASRAEIWGYLDAYTYRPHGTIRTEWVNGLIEDDFFVTRITRHVLDRLG